VLSSRGRVDLGLIKRLSDQRKQLIHDHARPHLEPGEEVLHWVRARRAEGRGEGFAFLTARRAVLAWSGRSADRAIAWADIETWGLNPRARGGPILGIRTPGEVHFVQLVAATPRMAADARHFVERFAELAPPAKVPFGSHRSLGNFETDGGVHVDRHKLSAWGLARRIAVTVLGVALIALGIAITPLPGPWSFLINIAGLAVLATEYDWAKDLLTWTRRKFEQAKAKVTARRARRPSETGGG
jgi:uncharacterized protein (TIGR02611 family)